jgi:hypothetical protein
MVQQDEDKIRKLQQELEFLMAHREQAVGELQAVKTYGHIEGPAAGVPASRESYNHTGKTARYELMAPPIQSGSSQDTLGQTVYAGSADHDRHRGPHAHAARSILEIGEHASASP